MAGYTRPIPLDLEVDNVEFSESITDAESNTVTSLSDPVRVTEEASTFAESGLTLTHNTTQIFDGSITLGTIDGSTASIGSYSSNYGTVSAGGIYINPNIPIGGVTATLDGNNTNYSTAYLNGPDISRVESDISDLSGGDTVTLNADLSAGTEYKLGIEGSSLYVANKDASYDYTSDDIDVTKGFLSSNDPISVNVYVWQDVQANLPATTGDAHISWDTGVPADIKTWDLATFQRTLGGETVTVDVEDSNGNVLISDISPNTDISSIPIDTEIQFRVNLSRSDTSNNPTLDYAARRYTR